MKLKKYIEDLPRSQRMAERKRLAAQAGVGMAAVGHWVAGIRRIPAERAVRLEQATSGRLSRQELRPDLFF